MRKSLVIAALAALLSLGMAGAALADQTVEIAVGPIWNDSEAQRKCEAMLEKVAQKYAGKTVSWDGNWKTITEGEQSVCSYLIGGWGGYSSWSASPLSFSRSSRLIFRCTTSTEI